MSAPQSQSAEHVPVARFRRNGQRQSCEPCRLSKLRCDHESPCARCVRRRKTCYFHPAPMSRDKHSAPRPATARPISLPTPPSPPRPLAMAATTSPRSTAPSLLSPRAGMPTPSNDDYLSLHPDPNAPTPLVGPYAVVGTLSSLIHNSKRKPASFPFRDVSRTGNTTSNAAMLLENRAVLKPSEWETGESTTTAEAVFEDAVRLGTFMMAWWPNRATCEKVTGRYLEMTGSATTLKPLYLTFQQRFWDTYGHFLEEPRTFSKMEQLSRELCHNTIRTRPVRPESSRSWIDSFTGANSRWDMIAVFFIHFSSMADLLHDAEQIYKELCTAPLSRQEYIHRAIECADNTRILLVDALDPQGSLLSVLLRAKASNRLTNGFGETSSQVWIRAGSVIAAATEFDLHRPAPVGTQPTLMYTELQKRVFSAAFGTACTLATFHGRPPLITRYYISSELPLDCTDEQLLDDDLDGIRASTNEHGWRRDGRISLATLSRGLAMTNIFREEILELSLGQRLAPAELTARVDSLRARSEEVWAHVPALVKVPLQRASVPLLRDGDCNLADVASLQLKWHQNAFLLERLVHPAQDKKRHLAAARRILADVVSLWGMRDSFPDNMDDMRWFIANHGIASFSSLGIDLYQQATNPGAAVDARDRSHRARDVQTLSKFGACLEWIDPRDGNYTMCQNANKMLLAILERVLAGPPSADDEAPPATGQGGAGDGCIDFDLANVELADVPAFGVDFHDWFNSEWSMPWTGQSYGGLEV